MDIKANAALWRAITGSKLILETGMARVALARIIFAIEQMPELKIEAGSDLKRAIGGCKLILAKGTEMAAVLEVAASAQESIRTSNQTDAE